jgi:threonine/homoserine/homoserine lactone efflux protein
MSTWLAVAGFVTVAAITPGPNNTFVLRAATRGFATALPAIAGIVFGGLVMLGIAAAGVGTIFATVPRLQLATAIAGAVYLAWLGVKIIRAAGAPPTGSPSVGLARMFVFQFLNPKGWMLVTVPLAASDGLALWQLALVLAIIPALCLAIWAAFGAALAHHLASRRNAARFDRVTGGLLIGSAVLLANGSL